MKHETSAGALVYKYNKDTNSLWYLVLKTASGYWDFPKGKLEDAETPQEAAQREVKEETGLDIVLDTGFEQSLSYYFKDKQGILISKTVTFFVAPAPTQQHVTLSYEHLEHKWLTLQEALKQLTYNNARQLLVMADRFVRNSFPTKPHPPSTHSL
jgi:bis(5'-nucleosidyl)-tetraphosphatase